MPRAALLTGLIVLALGFAISFLPFFSRDRETIAGTPVPPAPSGRHTVTRIPAGSELCLDSVTLTPSSEIARTRVGTYRRPGQPLLLTLRAPGYRADSRVLGGYKDNARVSFSITPPEHDLFAEACLRNLGRSKVAIYGTDEAYATARPSTTVGGKPIRDEAEFVLLERDRTSLASRIPDATERAALFRPGGQLLVWIVLLAAVAAVLAGPLVALHWSAARNDQ